MFMKIITFLSFIALLLPASLGLKNVASTHLSIKEVKNFTVFTGYCQNETNDSIKVSYMLKIEKSGISGKSTNKQEGKLALGPRENKICSTTKLGLKTGDTCTINFNLYQQNEIINQEKMIYIAE